MRKHVVIRPNDFGGMAVVVDGTDVSRWVARDGLTVEIRDGYAYVTLPVQPVMFSGVFPEAVVNALGNPEGATLSWAEVETVLNVLNEVEGQRGCLPIEAALRARFGAALAGRIE